MTREFDEGSYSAWSGCKLFLRRNGLPMVVIGIALLTLLWFGSRALGRLFWFGF